MNINIIKGVRKIRLAKRERDTLSTARQLLAEISAVSGQEPGEAAEQAAEHISAVLRYLAGPVTNEQLLEAGI